MRRREIVRKPERRKQERDRTDRSFRSVRKARERVRRSCVGRTGGAEPESSGTGNASAGRYSPRRGVIPSNTSTIARRSTAPQSSGSLARSSPLLIPSVRQRCPGSVAEAEEGETGESRAEWRSNGEMSQGEPLSSSCGRSSLAHASTSVPEGKWTNPQSDVPFLPWAGKGRWSRSRRGRRSGRGRRRW